MYPAQKKFIATLLLLFDFGISGWLRNFLPFSPTKCADGMNKKRHTALEMSRFHFLMHLIPDPDFPKGWKSNSGRKPESLHLYWCHNFAFYWIWIWTRNCKEAESWKSDSRSGSRAGTITPLYRNTTSRSKSQKIREITALSALQIASTAPSIKISAIISVHRGVDVVTTRNGDGRF